MELNLEIPRDYLFIRSVGADGIRVADDYYRAPLIISGQQLVPEWPVASFDEINEQNLQVVFEMAPEVVLIGCGKSQVFLPPATQMSFFRRGVGFEVMVTDAACRTYNLLASEGRHVVAALLPVVD